MCGCRMESRDLSSSGYERGLEPGSRNSPQTPPDQTVPCPPTVPSGPKWGELPTSAPLQAATPASLALAQSLWTSPRPGGSQGHTGYLRNTKSRDLGRGSQAARSQPRNQGRQVNLGSSKERGGGVGWFCPRPQKGRRGNETCCAGDFTNCAVYPPRGSVK